MNIDGVQHVCEVHLTLLQGAWERPFASAAKVIALCNHSERPARHRSLLPHIVGVPTKEGGCSSSSTASIPGTRRWRPPRRRVRDPLEHQGEVDVLIVGSGPAGLVLAAQLTQFEGITTRVVERRAGPLEFGQADGVACRTVEMLEAFGCSERLMAEAYWVNETRRSGGPTRPRTARIVARAACGTPTTSCRSSRTSSSTRRGCSSISLESCATRRSGSRPTTASSCVGLGGVAERHAPGPRSGCARGDERLHRRCSLCRGLRRSAQRGPAGDRARAGGRRRQPRLGRRGRPRGHRLP